MGIIFNVVNTLVLMRRRRQVMRAQKDLIGRGGVMLADAKPAGRARVRGANWRVVSRVPLRRGDKIRVTRIDGRTLSVEPEFERGKKS